MTDKEIPFSVPLITDEEIEEVVDTLKSRWITTGPKTKKFEELFAEFVNAPQALALNSCTAGLHTALATSGVLPGDEVISTPITFAASTNVIEHVGAKTVLVDVQKDTLNINPGLIEEKITKKTKAIMPVHYAGHPVDLDEINEIAEKYNLKVIEDAAHSLPAKYKGRFIGSGNNPAAFSFYATKNLTTGEGGMLTGSPEMIEKAKIFSLHGLSKDAWMRYSKGDRWFYEVLFPGFKYNMSDIQASLGIPQLKKLKKYQERRKEIVGMYNQAFSEMECLELPVERPEVEHSWHLYVIRLELEQLKINRKEFIEELTKRNIGTSVHFIPIHIHPYYRDKYNFKPEDFPVAYNNYQRVISLPLYPQLSNEDVQRVIENVIEIAKENRR